MNKNIGIGLKADYFIEYIPENYTDDNYFSVTISGKKSKGIDGISFEIQKVLNKHFGLYDM